MDTDRRTRVLPREPDPRFVCQADGYEAPEHLLVRSLDGRVLCVACARGRQETPDG